MIDLEFLVVGQHQALKLVFDLKANKRLFQEFTIKKIGTFACMMQSS